MSLAIAIIGASGVVGSALAAQILRSALLEPGDRLQLVGHGSPASEGKLLATRIDLLDAFDDERVDVEMVPDIADVDAEIVVISAGVGLSPQCLDRREIGLVNREIFRGIAETCARRVPEALFILVANPIELGVEILASRLDRKRVLGMGAQQDSLRFARAVARDLGISRHEVRASVLGEHGEAMVPLWSSVELLGGGTAARAGLERLKEHSAAAPVRQRAAALKAEVGQLLQAEEIAEAYEVTRRALPDARIFVEPFITGHSIHSTPNATANATLQCLAAAVADDRRRVHGQVMLEGELLGLHGICGVPMTLSRAGWRRDTVESLSEEEKRMLVGSVDSIRESVAGILAQPTGEAAVGVPGTA